MNLIETFGARFPNRDRTLEGHTAVAPIQRGARGPLQERQEVVLTKLPTGLPLPIHWRSLNSMSSDAARLSWT